MTEKQMKIIAEYIGIERLKSPNDGKTHSYHAFDSVEESEDSITEIKIRLDNPAFGDFVLELKYKYELIWNETDNQPKRIFDKQDNIVVIAQEEDNGNNNDKKAKDCPICLEQITHALAKTKCEDWETKRKNKIEDLKKGKCFHEKSDLPVLLDPQASANKILEHKRKCSQCQKEYVDYNSNGWGDEKKFTHNCSQKPDNQQDDEEENDDDEDDNSNNNKIAEKSTVRKYCRDNDIQKLEYDEETGKLIITYKKSNKPKSELENLSEELQEIKNYLKKKGQKDNKNKRRILVEDDWEETTQQNPNQNSRTDWTPWIIAGSVGLFIIVLIAVIGLVRKGD